LKLEIGTVYPLNGGDGPFGEISCYCHGCYREFGVLPFDATYTDFRVQNLRAYRIFEPVKPLICTHCGKKIVEITVDNESISVNNESIS
jgi:hypothetical protein